MNREDVHRAWAPPDDPWSAWVKPVLFAHLDDKVAQGQSPAPVDWLRRDVVEPLAAARPSEPHPYRSDTRPRDAALVVDVAGVDSVRLGATAAGLGWRPVPLFNGMPVPSGRVNVWPVMYALLDAVASVAAAPPGAPPAFLLDAHRVGQEPSPRTPLPLFDNRWRHHASDFPSAETLLAAGIRRVVLIDAQPKPALDLHPILFDWQARGLALWRKRSDSSETATPFTLRRPSVWTRLRLFLADSQVAEPFGDVSVGGHSG